jgi:glycosyltransferase involved in cell wall biosynthesis
LRVCVLTTSYPRFPGDVAGTFVADIVERVRESGAEAVVVSPADFPHFGIAFGAGIVQNLRAKPWLLLALPLFLAGFVRAARRAARGADVVHAHWLPSLLPALATRKPVVLQLWGSDAELAGRARLLVWPLVRRARCAVGASSFLAGQARKLGARRTYVIPLGIEIPDRVGEPAEPRHVLYVGRLSDEKGITDFLEATEGLPRVVVGDGPLRERVPEATGFLGREELGGYYERAAVFCAPSRREGYGVAAREAMAPGCPVVATAVGGLPDAVVDGITGLLVEPGSPGELREALLRLLGDRAFAEELGANAREAVRRDYSWVAATASLLALYAEVSRRTR